MSSGRCWCCPRPDPNAPVISIPSQTPPDASHHRDSIRIALSPPDVNSMSLHTLFNDRRLFWEAEKISRRMRQAFLGFKGIAHRSPQWYISKLVDLQAITFEDADWLRVCLRHGNPNWFHSFITMDGLFAIGIWFAHNSLGVSSTGEYMERSIEHELAKSLQIILYDNSIRENALSYDNFIRNLASTLNTYHIPTLEVMTDVLTTLVKSNDKRALAAVVQGLIDSSLANTSLKDSEASSRYYNHWLDSIKRNLEESLHSTDTTQDNVRSFVLYMISTLKLLEAIIIHSGSWRTRSQHCTQMEAAGLGNIFNHLKNYTWPALKDQSVLLELSALAVKVAALVAKSNSSSAILPPIPLESQIASSQSQFMDVNPLVESLENVFADTKRYRQLLACRKESAQRLLNMFQQLLDVFQGPTPKFRNQLIVSSQRLARRFGLYPEIYTIHGITDIPNYCDDNGGYAFIFKGKFRGVDVCLKALKIDKYKKHEFLKRFSEEAILWGQLSHPNVLPFYGVYPFRRGLMEVALVSPWMENGNITVYLADHSDADRVLLASDVAHGLKYLHDNDVIHGDLKGVGLLILESALRRLTLACPDFGLSSISDSTIPALTSYSGPASKGGTTRWQAPELINLDSNFRVPNTIESDVYAYGCLLYE
ncbi:hypothetical protein H0H93_005439, partial [Arthromyces matolae]